MEVYLQRELNNYIMDSITNHVSIIVSVIIPVYKVEKYLDECLTSIVNQSYKELEIVLVDDGSPDKCPELCDNWARKDKRISVIHKQNGGLSDARNVGKQNCHGTYILFVDSDDFIDKYMVENLLSLALKTGADVSACSIKRYKNGKSWRVPNNIKNKVMEFSGMDAIKAMLLEKIDCAAWNKLIKADVFREFDFPVGRYNEDIIFWFYSWQHVKKVVYTNEAYYNYRITANSLTHSFSERRLDYMRNAKEIKSYTDTYIPEMSDVADTYLNICASNTLMDLWYSKAICLYQDYYLMCRSIVINNYFKILFGKNYNVRTKIKSAVMGLIPLYVFKILSR